MNQFYERMICAVCGIASLSLMLSCGQHKRPVSEHGVLSVSIEPQRYLLERIAGPKWKVNTLLSRGEDPENFDPTLADLKEMHDSRAYFKVGTMAFEDELVSRSQTSATVYDTSAGIRRLTGTHGHCANHHHDDEEEQDHDHDHETDPHVWASLKNAKIMAANMLAAMIEIDPADSASYRRNYMALAATLDSCDRVISSRLKPVGHATFMVWHPSLSYFAEDYRLHQLSIGMDNKEMSAAAFRDRIDHAKEQGAEVFLVQPDFDAGRSVAIASGAGARSATVNTLSYDLPQELLRISNIISNH